MRPGVRLRSLARRVCSRSTMERLIDPVITDLQCEHDQAMRDARPWRRRWILLIGYLAFWKAVTLHVPIWTSRLVRRWAATKTGSIGGALGAAAGTMIVLTTMLIAAPWLNSPGALDGRQAAWLLLLLVPQSLPLTLPVVLLVGILCGLRNRTLTSRIRGAVLAIGLTGSAASLGTINWLIPAANQAFRETIAGRQLERGPAEMPLRSLREQALAMNAWGLPREAGSLLLVYHLRAALVGATLFFALFGLGVSALRKGWAATAAIAILFSVLYISYLFHLNTVSAALFSDERLALGAAWFPNVTLIAVSVAFLLARQDRRLPDQPAQE